MNNRLNELNQAIDALHSQAEAGNSITETMNQTFSRLCEERRQLLLDNEQAQKELFSKIFEETEFAAI